MNPKIKKSLIYLFILLGILGGIEIVISYFHEDRVKKIAVEELNALLNTKVTVESIDFSLLRQFPNASIEFRNIEVFDNTGKGISPLKAQSIFFEFNPFDLLTGTYYIDQIELNNAQINYQQYSTHESNFQFIQKDSSEEHFQISLEAVRINRTSFLYKNHKSGELVELDIHTLLCSGKLTAEVFDLNVDMYGNLNKLNIKTFRLKRAYATSLDFILQIDRVSKSIKIGRARTKLSHLEIDWNGSLDEGKNGKLLKLSFESQDAKLSDIRDVLPYKLIRKFDEFDATGHLDVDGEIEGLIGSGQIPSIELVFSLKNGHMFHKTSKVEMNDVNFHGSFSNGKNRSMTSSKLIIDTISFQGVYGASIGYLKIEDFNDPYLSFGATSVIDLSKLHSIIGNDSIDVLSGKCMFDIQSGFKIDSLSSVSLANLKKANTTGSIILDSVKFKHIEMPYSIENINGKLSFYAYNILLDSFHLEMEDVVVDLSGRLNNLLPYLFYKEEKLTISAKLHSPNMDLNKLFATNEDTGDKEPWILPYSDKLSIALDFNLDNFVLRKFKAASVKGQLKLKHPVLLLQNIDVQTMEGNFSGWIQLIKEKEASNIDLSSELKLSHVNIHELFKQFENFGQNVIIQDHVKGYADINMEFRSVLDLHSGLLANKTYVRSNIEVTNGELINYKPILALSEYIDIEELGHIKFSKLSNEIEIKDRMVYIPEMNVLSSALEIKLSGKHSFDNEFDYHFELYLSDLLFKKAKRSKKNQKEFGEIKADESGRSKIRVRMEGNLDDYTIKLDRKAIRESWNESFQEERKELNQIFKEEFSGQNKDENVAPMDFEIEWDDGSSASDTGKEKSTFNQKEKSKLESPNKKEKKKAWLDKIGGGNEDEYETYEEDKFD